MRGSGPFFGLQVVTCYVISRPTAWWKSAMALLAGCWIGLVVTSSTMAMALPAIEGLPVTRFYPFEEIGNVSRGAHLNFDVFGRIAVVQRGSYAVLNDGTWLELTESDAADDQILETRSANNGVTYYGALGSWGILVATPTGKLRPVPLVPAEYPKWVLATNFDQILCTSDGVYFAGLNGVVFWSRTTNRHQFFEVSGVSRLFSYGGSVCVSAHSKKVFVLDVGREKLVPVERSAFENIIVGRFAAAGPERSVVATTFRRLLVVRENETRPLPPPLDGTLPGDVMALESLPEGGVAASVAGDGLYILDADGNIKTKLTGPDYGQITALASNEAGILWAATETGVIKILHGHPYTVFGQALGLPVEWPQLVSWNGQLIVASHGRFYEPLPTTAEPTHFRQIPGQPGAGGWGISTAGASLLVGNGDGIYARDSPNGGFTLVVPGIDGARLVALDHETCLVISADEIAAVRHHDGVWSECAPRIHGLGYPFIVHRGKNAAWIELGVNRAARISLDSGRLAARVFESFPWTKPGWVNISVLGPTVVLAGPENKLVFFDENTQAVADDPMVRELFERSPHPIQRMCEDDTGTFWGSFQHGIISFARDGRGRLTIDSTTYGAINEQVPLVHALPGGDIWVSSGQSLYHLDRSRAPLPMPQFQPVLTSVRDGRTQAERFRTDQRLVVPPIFSYRENSITFTFFAGSYFWKRVPAYEFKLNHEPWRSVAGSSVVFSDLHEGDYQLSVRLADNRGPIGTAWHRTFSVTPPWYRTLYALATYPVLAAAVVFGLIRYSLRRAKVRTAALENLVADRTRELQTTMHKLQQETRTRATLAERNRLAGEIHDSLEQGFTGLTLQIETTANFAACPPEVKNGLTVALNMVAFSRNEVRHAVQNLHSPVLNSADLGTALKHIIAQTVPSPGYATVRTEGSPRPLGSTIEHHLLRIAQEAITNAVKHASASHLEVVLAFGASDVQLTICDDGRGFDPGVVLNGSFGHFGLPSFRGRASKIGGAVEIISRPGAGTRIVARVPLESDLSRQP